MSKTLTAISIIGRIYLEGKARKALIIAPASVVSVWPKELGEYGAFPYEVKALEGSSKNRIKMLNSFRSKEALQIAIINYEGTWRILEELLQWQPDIIIADESQRIKSPAAKQSKALHRLGDAGKYKLILSGTPVQNAPLDLWSQYRFLDKSIFGTSYYAFKARHAIMGGYGKHQVIGYRHMDELIRKAHGVALRVTKDEALDLPETTDEIRYCQLEPKAESLYKKLVKDSYIQLEKGEITAQNVLTRLLRLSQLTGGYIHTDEGITKEISTAKLEVLKEIVEDLMAAGKKLVIFARFLPEIKAIGKMLEKMGLEYSCITGVVKDRGEEVRRFQEEEECRVFIAQIQTAGLGITLHAADTAVFYSLDFNYANYAQAKARIHRIGQRNTCTYIHLMAPNTVDERIMAALEKKKNIAKEVVDNWREYFE
ncbi:DEAD/DEAH box helicase [Natronincola ferrireducens]|uniref:Helicase conserved C-terminal domain-containing protein n=1 Tax=Natronincola ferrireducens TaxID=393762 RepID=A0A1G9H9S1_9FIRM|nr:DEAD/DEAH box helicase [Natronincola ferrireducens]SDL09615.1 Helicase conserved C-terminal domain-containing protein [Natronincola ferrireducens]